MTSLRLHAKGPISEGLTVSLTAAMQQHLRARRLRQHTPFLLFNSHDGAFSAIRTSQNTAVILKRVAQSWNTPSLRLYIPMVKPKNVSLILTKATELGVTEFQPIVTQHTQVSTMNIERLEGACKEAVEQSERFTLPKIYPPMPLMQCLDVALQPILVALERTVAPSTSLSPACTSVLVGPEGGFSQEEKTVLQSHPLCHTFSLGPAILRAETAAICAVYHLQAHQHFNRDCTSEE